MRGLFSLVTLCAILTLSSCATYSFVDSGTNCEVAGKSSILTQTECEAAYATLASDAKDAGFAEASRGCMFRAASYNLYYSTTATGNFACSSQYRCVCSEPSAQPTDATTIDYDTTCYHLKSVYQDSACCSSPIGQAASPSAQLNFSAVNVTCGDIRSSYKNSTCCSADLQRNATLSLILN